MRFVLLDELRSRNDLQRNDSIDIVKGGAILLVVLGHALQSNLASPGDNFLYRSIYSFHMPLFIFISGYLAWLTFDGSRKKIFSRFVLCIVPFVVWALIYACHHKDPGHFLQLAKRFEYGLWFLPVLFEAFCILAIAKINPRLEIIILPAAFVVLYFFGKVPYLGILSLRWYFFFFITGYFLARYSTSLKKPALFFGRASLLLFPILVVPWNLRTLPDFAPFIHMTFGNAAAFILVAYAYIVPLSGIAFAITVLRHFEKRVRALVFFGMMSMEIYVSHIRFMELFNTRIESFPLAVTVSFLSGLCITFMFIAIVKQNAVLSLLLFGKRSDARFRRSGGGRGG